MKLDPKELAFLSAWAREERTDDPYLQPAHRLQAEHRVSGVTFLRLIKAWARAEGRKDEDIFNLSNTPNPDWPWSAAEELQDRFREERPGETGVAKEPGCAG